MAGKMNGDGDMGGDIDNDGRWAKRSTAAREANVRQLNGRTET